jgi:hypothetical protein
MGIVGRRRGKPVPSAGGRIRANIRVQEARQEAALARYEQTVLVALEDTENTLVAYGEEQTRLCLASDRHTGSCSGGGGEIVLSLVYKARTTRNWAFPLIIRA